MNQVIADAIRSLPWWLRDTYILGWLYLVLCCLGYVYFLRPTLWHIVRARLPERVIQDTLPTRASRLFFNGVKKKAHLWDNGWFTVNRILLPLLPAVVCLHGVASILALTLPTPPALLQTADTALLSVLFFVMAVLLLMTQPRATMERRKKWGFRPLGNLVHTVLWELIIVFLLFLWLYVAYFLALL